MNEMAAAGQEKSKRYKDLFYIHEEQAEEEDQRDFSRVAKDTQPVLNHSAYACIGTSSCNKQQPIMKLFPETLKSCEKLQEANRIQKKSSLTTKNADASSFKRADSNISAFDSPQRGSAAKSINYEIDNESSPAKTIPMIRM